MALQFDPRKHPTRYRLIRDRWLALHPGEGCACPQCGDLNLPNGAICADCGPRWIYEN